MKIQFIFRYSIDDWKGQQLFLLNMEVNICLEAAGPCTLELPILKDLKVPKPVCNLEKSFYSFGIYIFVCLHYKFRGCRGRDRMVVGFYTTYAISAYHHWCEFESRSGRGVQHYVIKFVSDLRQVLRFPPPIKLTASI